MELAQFRISGKFRRSKLQEAVKSIFFLVSLCIFLSLKGSGAWKDLDEPNSCLSLPVNCSCNLNSELLLLLFY